MVNTLVTGGSGFIGRTVIRRLTKAGIHVISVDLLPPEDVAGYEFVKADALDYPTAQRILTEFDVQAVVHLIGLPLVPECQRNPQLSFNLNVLAVQNMLEAARGAGVQRFVFASSANVYGSRREPKGVSENEGTSPDNVYGHHKVLAEEIATSYAEMYGLKTTALRIFNVFGQGRAFGKDVISQFVRNATEGRPLTVNGPRKFRDFVHVDDVAEAFYACLARGANSVAVNVGTGIPTTLGQLARMVAGAFPSAAVQEQSGDDDGTGIVANIEVARTELGLRPRNPGDAIAAFLAQCKSGSRELTKEESGR